MHLSAKKNETIAKKANRPYTSPTLTPSNTGKETVTTKLDSHWVGSPNGHASTAHRIREHLREHHPRDGAPSHAERHHEQIGAHQSQRASHRTHYRRAVSHRSRTKQYCKPSLSHDHADGSREQQRFTPNAINKHHANKRCSDVDQRSDGGDGKRVLFAEAYGAPQRVRIVENDVDASELIEDHEADSRPNHWFQPAVCPIRSRNEGLRSALRDARMDASCSSTLISASPIFFNTTAASSMRPCATR